MTVTTLPLDVNVPMNKLYNHHEENINNFANALEDARNERMGVSIEDIGKCFRYQFDEAELLALIKELTKPKL